MRLVDADKLIERFDELCLVDNEDGTTPIIDNRKFTRQEIEDEIMDVPNINIGGIEQEWYHKGIEYGQKHTVSHPEWIPCEDRLPTSNTYNLVTVEKDGELYVFCLHFDNGYFWLHNSLHEYKGVVAWMPRPEPYEREEK